LEFPNGHNIITMQHGSDFLRSETEIAEISHRRYNCKGSWRD
jgi:hypothetical protein